MSAADRIRDRAGRCEESAQADADRVLSNSDRARALADAAIEFERAGMRDAAQAALALAETISEHFVGITQALEADEYGSAPDGGP